MIEQHKVLQHPFMKPQIANFKTPAIPMGMLHHLNHVNPMPKPMLLSTQVHVTEPKQQLFNQYYKNGLLPRSEGIVDARVMGDATGIPLGMYENIANDVKYPNYFKRSGYETIKARDVGISGDDVEVKRSEDVKPVSETVDEGEKA